MTWPLIARLGTHLPLGNADIWLNYWNLWWWKVALFEGRSPYFTDLIFFPGGAPLGLHTHSPANMLWTLGIKRLGSVKTSVYGNMQPVFGVAAGMLILNERLGLLQLLGALTVLAGIMVVNRRPRDSRQRP